MESPSGARLTSLGSYLFVSLVFAFLPIVEFALVLSIKEVKNRGTQGTSLLTNDKSKSKKEFLKDQKGNRTLLLAAEDTDVKKVKM